MNWSKRISRHKCIEIGWNPLVESIRFGITTELNFKCTYAGWHTYITIFKKVFTFNIRDLRKWDHDNDCWEELSEPSQEQIDSIKDPRYENEYEDVCVFDDDWDDYIGI